MGPGDFILAILAALPGHQIKGKKRLQKLAFFLTQAGVRSGAEFHIRDFGPFSVEIANAARLLTATAKIAESEEPAGASNTFVTVFKLNPGTAQSVKPLLPKYQKILQGLNRYPSIDLEVAATAIFFQAGGLRSDVAIRKTKELKPTKASAQILKKIPAIADCLRGA
jgi:hypothetical protein